MKKYLKRLYTNNIVIQKLASKLLYFFGRNRVKVIGKENVFEHENALLKRVSVSISGNHNKIIISRKARLSNVEIIMRGNNHTLEIKDNCIINNSVLWFEDGECSISIGKETTIEGAHIAVTEPSSKISLGDYCMLSSGIDIRNGDSHSIISLNDGKRINYAKDIFIGDQVWIGNGAEILKGVNIGSGSVVGIRSVVTKDIPENSISAGNPAKIVKTNITWNRKRVYI